VYQSSDPKTRIAESCKDNMEVINILRNIGKTDISFQRAVIEALMLYKLSFLLM